MSEWISILEKLPKANNRYLFLNGKREVTFGYMYPLEEGWDTGIEGRVWINDFESGTNEIASHYMELPEAPK